MGKLNVKGFALAFGIITGIWMFALALLSLWSGWGRELVFLYSSLFLGYGTSIGGAIIGFVWGVIYGGIFGFLIAWLYNAFVK
ncbi:MAG: hypothetical protein WD003_01270 [Candidatus Paceibacterota bacterium]